MHWKYIGLKIEWNSIKQIEKWTEDGSQKTEKAFNTPFTLRSMKTKVYRN
ncbi:MAG: hypothetical protein PF541_01515 [Prolixibacteraceae bacterium]|jgi:hypothetical protein|nr:hypothetical protein [Prolixibacteraceae bacterium]